MSDAIVVKDRNGLQALLDGARASIAAVLPKQLEPERLIKVAMIAAAKQPLLYECTKMSLLQSIMLGAELGLEAGGPLGHLWLVPFRNKGRLECTPIIGYQGYVELAFRSDRVRSIEARVVHEKDKYEVAFGRELKLEHRPCLIGDPGKPIFVYSVAHLEGGGVQADVMSVDDVEKIRKRSWAKDNGPWVTDWEPMAAKTTFRRLAKWLPKSIELGRALEFDEEQERGEEMSIEVAGMDPLEPSAPAKTQKLKEHVAAKVAPAAEPGEDYSDAEKAELREGLKGE